MSAVLLIFDAGEGVSQWLIIKSLVLVTWLEQKVVLNVCS